MTSVSGHASTHPPADAGWMKFFLSGVVVGMVVGSILGLFVGSRSGGVTIPESARGAAVTGGSHDEEPATPLEAPPDSEKPAEAEPKSDQSAPQQPPK